MAKAITYGTCVHLSHANCRGSPGHDWSVITGPSHLQTIADFGTGLLGKVFYQTNTRLEVPVFTRLWKNQTLIIYLNWEISSNVHQSLTGSYKYGIRKGTSKCLGETGQQCSANTCGHYQEFPSTTYSKCQRIHQVRFATVYSVCPQCCIKTLARGPFDG